jgi:hypothetical protein
VFPHLDSAQGSCYLCDLSVGMRVIDLDTGDTLQAANDRELALAVETFYTDLGEPMSGDEATELVVERAYDATDS